MKVKIKRLSDKAVIPQYAKEGDAGMDLVATSADYCENTNSIPSSLHSPFTLV